MSPMWLGPGDNFPITGIIENKFIDSINVLWKDGGTNATGTLYIYGTPIEIFSFLHNKTTTTPF